MYPLLLFGRREAGETEYDFTGGALPSGKPIGRAITAIATNGKGKQNKTNIPTLARYNAWRVARGLTNQLRSPVNAVDMQDYAEYVRRVGLSV